MRFHSANLVQLDSPLGQHRIGDEFGKLFVVDRQERADLIIDGDDSIWIHAVSVGEVLTARAIAADLKTRYPRLRLELRTALSWKSDVEYALEKLLGSMTPDALLRPVRPAPATRNS